MLYDITARDRGLLYQTKLAFVDTAMSWVAPTLIVLMARWARELGPVRVAMTTAIIHMTLANGRAACELPLSIFDQGNIDSDECPVFAGLGLSINSARRHLDGLCSADFLNVYRVVADKKHIEMSARVVEINFTKLFSATEIAKVGMNLNGITPHKFGRGPYEYIHRYFVPSLSLLGLGKPKLVSPAFGAAMEAVGQNNPGEHMLAVPKKQRTRAERPDSTTEAIASVQARSSATRRTRVVQATQSPVGELTEKRLQAVLDKYMEEYMPSHPRIVVTDKPFSVMRKRLVEARIKDLGQFISYVIRHWPTLAAQNQIAIRKDPSKALRGSPLPSSPSFSALAYKLPYFIAAYSNSLTDTGKATSGKSPTQLRVEQLEYQLAQSRKDIEVLRRTRRAAAPRQQPMETLKADDNLLTDDWVPPIWSGETEKRKKA